MKKRKKLLRKVKKFAECEPSEVGDNLPNDPQWGYEHTKYKKRKRRKL